MTIGILAIDENLINTPAANVGLDDLRMIGRMTSLEINTLTATNNKLIVAGPILYLIKGIIDPETGVPDPRYSYKSWVVTISENQAKIPNNQAPKITYWTSKAMGGPFEILDMSFVSEISMQI